MMNRCATGIVGDDWEKIESKSYINADQSLSMQFLTGAIQGHD